MKNSILLHKKTAQVAERDTKTLFQASCLLTSRISIAAANVSCDVASMAFQPLRSQTAKSVTCALRSMELRGARVRAWPTHEVDHTGRGACHDSITTHEGSAAHERFFTQIAMMTSSWTVHAIPYGDVSNKPWAVARFEFAERLSLSLVMNVRPNVRPTTERSEMYRAIWSMYIAMSSSSQRRTLCLHFSRMMACR